MSPVDIFILVLAVGIVMGSFAFALYRRKAGKSGCGGGCRSCPYSDNCTSHHQEK